MKKIFLFVFVFGSLISKGQSKYALNKIDADFKNYLKTVFEPTFQKKKKRFTKNIVFGKIQSVDTFLQITTKSSFTVSSSKSNDKLMAAILFGMKHFSTYHFMADDFGQANQSNEFLMKELLRIKIHAIPDTNKMTLSNSRKINNIENVKQYNIGTKVLLNSPIIITYYTSQYENEIGLNKNIKTVIRHKNRIIYSSVKDGYKTTISNTTLLNKYKFIYNHNGNLILSSGGLLNLVLNNYLKNIKKDVHIEANNISNVTDFYANQNKDLKRVSNRGILKVKPIDSKELLSML